ncbi:unnamed protein product [Bursaphelenchus okinawaensis]|uniref:Uncharacterized protein n=1 Tax=Bursaphelenchus okinawaensis TaxID=465554 RepID=A0A811KRH2_9BILA|nr:unnamed protein product [Bursaphelenchus okinawaensis]CAG9110192.1 unnamed protein product [Bursaphelenchus okinawaensis]
MPLTMPLSSFRYVQPSEGFYASDANGALLLVLDREKLILMKSYNVLHSFTLSQDSSKFGYKGQKLVGVLKQFGVEHSIKFSAQNAVDVVRFVEMIRPFVRRVSEKIQQTPVKQPPETLVPTDSCASLYRQLKSDSYTPLTNYSYAQTCSSSIQTNSYVEPSSNINRRLIEDFMDEIDKPQPASLALPDTFSTLRSRTYGPSDTQSYRAVVQNHQETQTDANSENLGGNPQKQFKDSETMTSPKKMPLEDRVNIINGLTQCVKHFMGDVHKTMDKISADYGVEPTVVRCGQQKRGRPSKYKSDGGAFKPIYTKKPAVKKTKKPFITLSNQKYWSGFFDGAKKPSKKTKPNDVEEVPNVGVNGRPMRKSAISAQHKIRKAAHDEINQAYLKKKTGQKPKMAPVPKPASNSQLVPESASKSVPVPTMAPVTHIESAIEMFLLEGI